jgi:M6 family metalloprotease-like protein
LKLKYRILITPLLWGVFLCTIAPVSQAMRHVPSVLANSIYTRSPAAIQTDLHARILAIRVDFAPDTLSTTTGNGTFNSGIPDTLLVDAIPHNRAYFEDHLTFLDNYFSDVSKEHVTIDTFAVFPQASDSAYHLPNQMWHYNYNSTQQDLNMRLAWLFRDAWQAADSQAFHTINFSDYNTFIIFHAGVGQDYNVGFDETPHDIPSAYFSLTDLRDGLNDPSYPGVVVYGDTIRSGLLLPECEHQQEAPVEIAMNGTEALLFAHSLGLPALYNTNDGSSGVGRFDLMDQGSGNFAGIVPSRPCAWSRSYMGWEIPVVIDPDTSHQIYHVNITGRGGSQPNLHEIYRINLNPNEYYLIENRSFDPDTIGYTDAWDRQGRRLRIYEDYNLLADQGFGVITRVDNYDFGLPGEGILIWRVDDSVIQAKRDSNKVNTNMNHRGVALVEADGADDIGRSYGFFDAGWGTELGWSGDFFFLGNEAFLAANHNLPVVFNDNTYPSARTYSGGYTGLSVENFSDADTVMTFQVRNLWTQDGFPRALVEASGSLSPSALDFDDDGKTDWILTVTPGGAVQAFDNLGRAQGNVYETHLHGDSLVTDTLLARLDSILATPAIITRDYSFTAMIPSHEKAYWLNCDTMGLVAVDTIPLDARAGYMPIAAGGESGTLAELWYLGDDAGNLYYWDINGLLEGAFPVFPGVPITGMCWSDSSSYTYKSLFVVSASDSVALVRETSVIWKKALSFTPAFPPIAMYSSTGSSWDLAAVGNGGEVALLNPADGSYRPGFPMNAGMTVTASPAAADFDHDGRMELLLTGENRLQAIASNGALVANWPLLLDPRFPHTGIQSQPAIATLSNLTNALPRVIFGWPNGMVDARDTFGRQAANFPRQTGFTVQSAPLLLQLDGDDASELAALDSSGNLSVWNLANMGNYTLHKRYWNGLANGNLRQGLALADSATAPLDNRILIVSKVYPWPNPARDISHIRYKMGQAGTITVRIFDVSGDLIQELKQTAQVGQEADLDWNLSGISSGVYIGRVEVEGGGTKENTFIKIAVVK